MINSISRMLYKAARISRWAQAVNMSVKKGSPAPLIKRVINVGIGRKIVSKMFLGGKK